MINKISAEQIGRAPRYKPGFWARAFSVVAACLVVAIVLVYLEPIYGWFG